MATLDYSQYGEIDGEDMQYEYGEYDDRGEPVNLSNTDGIASRTGKETDDEKKLFVGGLGWGITQEDLQSHFAQFGGIEQVTLKTNPSTGRSRGFAFIHFSDKDALETVLMAGPHVINGTEVEPKRVKARNSGNNKIFVGGLDPDFPESELRAYFERFGKVEGIELPFDRVRNQRKQFSFVSFESEDVVDRVCKQPRQRIGGRDCDVKKAIRRQGGGRDRGFGRGPSSRSDFGRDRRLGLGSRSFGQSRSSSFNRDRGSGYGQRRSYGDGGSYSGYGSSSRSQNYGGYGGYGGYSQNGYGK